jgi:predicted membrane protein
MILAVAVSVIAIFIPSFILEKWFEGFVFFVCHWLIREQYPEQYHHIIPSSCRLITSVTFFFGVSFILPFSLSVFSAVPINYFIGWMGFTKKQADTFEFKYEKLKAELERKSNFNTDNCTLEQLLSRCKEIGLSKENTELAVEFFINKTKQSDIADKLCVEEASIRIRKHRLKEKLNKNDKN